MSNVATMGVGSTDIFIAQQPYASWTVGVNTATWYSPIPQPALTDDQIAAGSYYVRMKVITNRSSNSMGSDHTMI